MTDKEKISALIDYLHALKSASDSGVKVHTEIRATIKELERLLSN